MTSIAALATAIPIRFGVLPSAAKSNGSIHAPSVTTASAVSDLTAGEATWPQAARQALSTLKQLVSQRRVNGTQAAADLQQMANRRGDAIKKAALEKLALLKAKLKNLMLVGGDPASRARQAAEIAKEIGRTAREYACVRGGRIRSRRR